MTSNAVVSDRARTERSTISELSTNSGSIDSLFERVAWLYAFCREHLFRDDTERIISTVWTNGGPEVGTKVIELGCGPGFYSRKLAQRFPHISVMGVDRSRSQIRAARERAAIKNLKNCVFDRLNALALPTPDASFDVLITSRIFTVISDHGRAVAEMFRVLKSGGRCFIAEPRHAFWASIPLTAMWLLAGVIHSGNGYREPKRATVLSEKQFAELFHRFPWKSVRVWQDGRYQYALCEKA